MKMQIEDISYSGMSFSTQTEFRVAAKIDGEAVVFWYKDAGNNAEYKVSLDVDGAAKNEKYQDILWDWVDASGGDGIFHDLSVGEVVDLTPYVPAKAPTPSATGAKGKPPSKPSGPGR